MMLNRFLKDIKIDSIVKGYRVIKSIEVSEFRMTALELVHEKTNAKHIHLIRDDRNKTFCVQFKTPPPNNSGVPHILEHTVLCGSDKYPVRDPFFKMLTRSQATFMNAMTANDWTLYPFSSMNETDFFNLLSVYMDAVFRPKLEETDFMQEGWRLEPSPADNSTSEEFQIKGVVYNEMKGVFSSGLNNLAYQVERNILPQTYPFISGGIPCAIPQLSHDQLRSFHKHLYHPSNSKFFTYGNIDLEKTLDIIDSEYLQKFNKIDTTDLMIDLEPKWTAPKSIDIQCQTDPMAADPDRQCSVVVSFAIDDSKNTYLDFTMGLISSLLLNGDNSPLYQALIESGIGQDWASNLCGFDSSNRTSVFYIGLQGVRQSDMNRVEEIVLDVLSKVIRDGFPNERLESLIHQIELGLRHDNADFGLRLILGLGSGINHNAPLEGLLKNLEYVKQIRIDLSDNPQYLKDLVKKYLLNNPHRLTARMSPISTLDVDNLAKEQRLIAQLNSKLSVADKAELTKKCEVLNEARNRTEDLNSLPCLKISDIPKESDKFPFKISETEKCQINEYDTNGILYLKMLFSLRDIDQDLLSYLPILSSVLTCMSTSSMHYRDLDQAAESCSGGLSANLHLSGNINSFDTADVNIGFLLSSHCLYKNTAKVLELWSNILHEVRFDDLERLSTLIRMESTGPWSADGISNSAHRFAMRRAVASLTPIGNISEIWSGLEQARLMKSLAIMSHEELKERVVPKLVALKTKIFDRSRLRCSINLEGSAIDSTLSLLGPFRSDLSTTDSLQNALISTNTVFEKKCQVVLPYNVNYVSTAIKSVAYTHPHYARTRVLSKLMSSKFLHRQIREIGGAYGSGVLASPGHFTFFSYRDPNCIGTLDTFNRGLDWVLTEPIINQSLDEAKLSVFQEIDKPLSAGSKGSVQFLDSLSDEMRQQQRDRLFGVTVQDLQDAAESLKNSGEKSSVVIGPDQFISSDWSKVFFNK